MKSLPIAVLALVFALSGCSSSPPSDSSGFCTKPGDVREFKSAFEICLQRDDFLAWFSKGSEIEKMLTIGRIVFYRAAKTSNLEWEKLVSQLNIDMESDGVLVGRELWVETGLIESISTVAGGEPRWDSLLVALGKFESASASYDAAFSDWFQLVTREVRSRGSVSARERLDLTQRMNQAEDTKTRLFLQTLVPEFKPFVSAKLEEIGIQNEFEAAELTLQYLKSKG